MLKKLGFHYKLFFSFSIFVFIVLTVSGIIFYFYTLSIIEKNVAENQKQTTQKLQEQLDSLLYEMDRITIAVNSSNSIMAVLKNIPDDPSDNYFDKNPRIRDTVRDALYSFVSLKPLRGRLSLISREFDYVDLTNKFNNQITSKDFVKGMSEINKMMMSDQYKIFLPPHQDEWSMDEDIVFSVARPMRDNFDVYGIVEMSLSVEEIDNICDFKGSNKKIYVAIYDQNNKLIYDNLDGSKLEKEALYNKMIASSAYGSYIVNNEENKSRLIASFSRLSNVNWTVVQFEDMEEFRQPVNFLGRIILTTYISVFIILLAVLYFFTGSLTKPIRRLKNSLAQVDVENLRLVVNHKSTNNEITLLGEAFQDLLNEVKDSTGKLIQSRAREVKAHMLALQAQLNPHFLYNTLAVIGAYGQKKGNIEVMQMCSDLSKMLRYTVGVSDKNTTIKSEIEHIECYLKLMDRRYEGFLEYQISMDEFIDNIIVPKLILEPIIENIFRHGLKDIDPSWRVKVEGYRSAEYWYIRISDNGKGFSQEALNSLNKKLDDARNGPNTETYSSDVERGGLGLVNTFMRLNIFYGGRESIKFSNIPEGGSEIIIGGPIDFSGGQNV